MYRTDGGRVGGVHIASLCAAVRCVLTVRSTAREVYIPLWFYSSGRQVYMPSQSD